ncbi:MAG: glycoside hydrolase family 16 protein [Spirochaetes bacterium]|nr:glycoside hydrolase family 16 protein [Spirochaetota bacterium]
MTVKRGFLAWAICGGALLAFTLSRPVMAQERNIDQWLRFSGYIWTLRQSEEPGGPMGNRFAGQDLSVFLNPDKSLTLTLSRNGGLWYGGEASLSRRLGYGIYLFRVRTRLSELDPNLVLGLFTYSPFEKRAHDEIDIEFSAWGQQQNPVLGQYVVQPYDSDGHMVRFDLGKSDGPATYSFAWDKDRIEFLSWKGYGPQPLEGSPSILVAWSYSGRKDMPDPRRANIFMNLYLAGKPEPAGSGLVAVIVDSFEFIKKK